MQINTIEQDVAKEIINIGLSKAADSLSFFTKGKVFIRGTDFQLEKIENISPISKKIGKDIHVLTTEIKGDMQGFCFLIFEKSEVSEFLDLCLPKSIQDDPEKFKMMGEATIKEADNIITASVVTQFSNLLNVNIHGYVPFLDILDSNELQQYILDKGSELDYVLNFNSTFVSDDIDIKPEFLWILDSQFVNKIQNVIENEDVIAKVKSMAK